MELNSLIFVVIIGGVLGFGEVMVWEFVSYGVKVVLFDLNVERGFGVVEELGGVFCEMNVIDEESVNVVFVKF